MKMTGKKTLSVLTGDLNPSGISRSILGGEGHACVMDCALSHAQKTSQLYIREYNAPSSFPYPLPPNNENGNEGRVYAWLKSFDQGVHIGINDHRHHSQHIGIIHYIFIMSAI